MPITSLKFGSIDPILGKETDDDNGQFVSSVCWRRKSDMVVAANSSGLQVQSALSEAACVSLGSFWPCTLGMNRRRGSLKQIPDNCTQIHKKININILKQILEEAEFADKHCQPVIFLKLEIVQEWTALLSLESRNNLISDWLLLNFSPIESLNKIIHAHPHKLKEFVTPEQNQGYPLQ
ncbi:unnamed protein product [Ilex paraguariensis]|uniref:Uncharacterized protein n=1 Tax=Ilex paraguariensis TaxID=185542 RepID=A0ABC8T7H2_9AQUA